MFFPEDEKEDKEEALKKLIETMRSEMGDRVGKAKKPFSASMTIEKVPDSDMKEDLENSMSEKDDDDMGNDDDGISDEDKDKIREMYHKFCV